ncbi:MAG: hypothetical protein P8M22_11495 [Phycisphaerales bacterium]|nr:hypothetical protein [Phycisphaerales bacterium]
MSAQVTAIQARRTIGAFIIIMLSVFAGGCGGSGFDYDRPDALVIAMHDAMENEDPVLVWEALPSTWRSDINGVVHAFGQKLDAKAYDAAMNTARKAVKVLADKKEFILNSAMGKMFMAGMKKSAGEQAELVMENYDLIVKVMEMLVNSDLGTAEGLMKVKLGQVIGAYGPEIMKMMKQIANTDMKNMPSEVEQMRNAFNQARTLKSTVKSVDGDKAVIVVSMNQRPDETTEMIKIDDRWVPALMSKQFAMVIPAVKAELTGMDGTTINTELVKIQPMLPMIDSALDAMEKADTQEAFDQAMMGIAGAMMPRPS